MHCGGLLLRLLEIQPSSERRTRVAVLAALTVLMRRVGFHRNERIAKRRAGVHRPRIRQ